MPSTTTSRLEGLTTSVAIKAPCRAATTANITLSGLQTIDGIALAAGDRVLVKSQTTASENGIYEANSTAWTRAADFDGSLDVVRGTLVSVHSGTINARTYWEITTADPITIGTTSIAFGPAVIAASDGSFVETVASLAGLPTSNGAAAVVTETGRSGLFKFSTADLSAQVTLDTYQGIYVAPTSDTDGSSGAWIRQYNGPIELSWFGVASGASTLAARVESAFNLPGATGDTFYAHAEHITFDRYVQNTTRPIRLVGAGVSSNTSRADAATRWTFPSGSSGLVFLHTGGAGAGAQRSSVENMTIDGSSKLTTSAIYDYTAGSTSVTITSGTNDYSAGQIIRLEGAGTSKAVPGKTAAITSGTNLATITSAMGNPGVYLGQPISIAGAGTAGAALVGFVGAWTSTTITIVDVSGAALNAATTVSTAAYTVTYPLVCRLSEVSGSTLTLDQTPSNTQSVTGGVIKHADTGLYASCTLDTRHVFSGGGMHCGLVLHGEGGTAIADNGNHLSSNFQGDWCGVSAYGFDAQVNNFFGCNFAWPEVQFLDASLLGNQLIGGHMAFNIGVAVVQSTAYTSLIGVYFEGGTSALGNDTFATAYGCLGLRNGTGFKMWGATDLPSSGNSPSLTIDPVGGQGFVSAKFLFATNGQLNGGDYASRFENTDGARPTGSAGKGIELTRDATRAYVTSYDATGTANAPLRLRGSVYELLTASLGDYADDAAAAAGGVSVGQQYRNGSVLMIRVA